MNDINSICFTVVCLLLWFHTETLLSYAQLFGLRKLFKISDFEEDRTHDFTIEYPHWLYKKHPGFLTKLLSCPWCIGFWICLSSCLFYGDTNMFFAEYLISMITYFLVSNKIL